MIKEIALILVNKLVGLPFVQVLAGLVQTVTSSDPSGETGQMVQKKYPVSTDTNIPHDCKVTNEHALIPNSARASIIYFEDLGTSLGSNRGRFQTYNANLRLVCWYNKKNLFADPALNSSGTMIATIIKRLETIALINTGMFLRMKIHPTRIPIMDASIFSRYSYKEEDRQYLRPPFDFFAIDFLINYELNTVCL